MLKILFTGGGTAGHVLPNIALAQYVQSAQAVSILYVGSKTGIEKRLVKQVKIPYQTITTGKLRRSFDWRNLFTPFQLLIGIFQSYLICQRFKPAIVFSKGGFVAFPLVIGAWLSKIPIVVHESDIVPGLANRMSFPLAQAIFLTFNKIDAHYAYKTKVTGLPIRSDLLVGNPCKGRSFLDFDNKRPILFVWGGSLGALSLNQSIIRLLPELLTHFQLVHICGINKKIMFPQTKGYRVFDYLDIALLSDVLACATLVVSRAGATAIYELLMLKKPHILCPLSKAASRGEQIYNAKYCMRLGLSKVVMPEQFNDAYLMMTIKDCLQRLPEIKKKLEDFPIKDGSPLIYNALKELIAI